MGEMVNRIAKAIYEQRNGFGCRPWVRLPADHKQPYEMDARAALAALREPTDAMLRTGSNTWHERIKATETYPHDRGVWRAMVDEAMKVPV